MLGIRKTGRSQICQIPTGTALCVAHLQASQLLAPSAQAEHLVAPNPAHYKRCWPDAECVPGAELTHELYHLIDPKPQDFP